jgi:hypothetical protein
MKSLNYNAAAVLLFLFCGLSAAAQTEKPFTIFERSMYFSRADVKKELKRSENSIDIIVSNVSGGSPTMTKGVLPPAQISAVDVLRGNAEKSTIANSGRGQKVQLTNVVYPIRTRLTVNGEIFDIEIKDPGYWKMTLVLNQ